MANETLQDVDLPSQVLSTEKRRPVTTPEGVVKQIRILTCQTTAAHYCLFFTNRIGLAGMAERIDKAVDRMLSYERRSYENDQIHVIGSTDLGRWLAIDNRVPFFSLLQENGRKPQNWREQLSAWLNEEGVALIAYGEHARSLVEDGQGNFVRIDPGTARKEVINLADLPEESFYRCMLIPPLPEETTVGMINMLRQRVELLRPILNDGKRFNSLVCSESSTWTPVSLEIIEKDYLTHAGGIKVKRQQIKERGLPKVVIRDVEEKGTKDVVIESPQGPPINVTSAMLRKMPPPEAIKITPEDLSPPPPITVDKSSILPVEKIKIGKGIPRARKITV